MEVMSQGNARASTDSAGPLIAREFAWGEFFVLIPLHAFWVLFKSTPFVAENSHSAMVAAVPLGVMLAVGLAMRSRRVRAAIVGIEWLLHLSAATCMAVLLLFVTLRDPFNPIVPITWPLCFWSIAIAFVLLADLAVHERVRGCGDDSSARKGRARSVVVGGALWVALVWLAAGMDWTPYFFTTSLVFHALMAGTARRCCDVGKIHTSGGLGNMKGTAAFVETLFAVSLMLTALPLTSLA